MNKRTNTQNKNFAEMFRLLNWLRDVKPELHKQLKMCEHSYEGQGLTPFHAEQVLAHIQMVMLALQNTKRHWLILAALLHDIAKPDSVSTNKDGYKIFWGHEEKSFQMTKELLSEYPELCKPEDISKVLDVVKNHGILYSKTPDEIYEVYRGREESWKALKEFIRADGFGSIATMGGYEQTTSDRVDFLFKKDEKAYSYKQ